MHELVLTAHVGPCPPGMECRHLDGDEKNNALSNLVWGTPPEQALDRVRHGTADQVGPAGKRLVVRCVPSWLMWARSLADEQHLTLSDLIVRELESLAERIGHQGPPERRFGPG